MEDKKVMVTKEGFEAMQKELEEIDAEILATQVKMGESAKIDNDLRENPEFMELRVKAMYTLPEKKEKIADKIRRAVIVDETTDNTTVNIGSTVTVLYDDEEEPETFTIRGSGEGDWTKGIIACDAPLAEKIIGKHVNDVVQLNGSNITIKKIK